MECIFMGYLVCKECNGYYELDEGESLLDFESCQCGGELTYVETLDDIKENYSALEKSEICPTCGKETRVGSRFCANCGGPIKSDKIKNTLPDELTQQNKSSNKKVTPRDKISKKVVFKSRKNRCNLRFKAISIGVLIILIINFLFKNIDSNAFLFALEGIPILIGGFVAAFIVDGKEENGILNGAIVGVIAGLILLLISFAIFAISKNNYAGFIFNANHNLGYFLAVIVIFLLISALGGFLAILTRKILKMKQK